MKIREREREREREISPNSEIKAESTAVDSND